MTGPMNRRLGFSNGLKGHYPPLKREEAIREAFKQDSEIIGVQTEEFLRLVYPSYLVDVESIEDLLLEENCTLWQSMIFFRICSCTVDNADQIFAHVNERFEKLFTALCAINIPVTYGIVSRGGVTQLVLGVCSKDDVASVKTLTQGMLSGIHMEEIVPDFSPHEDKQVYHGILTGVPSLYVKEEKQPFSLAPIMHSLNGQDYTLLFIAKPVSRKVIEKKISALIAVRDQAFAVSKRNIARASSFSDSQTESHTDTDGQTNTDAQVGGGVGASLGGGMGAAIGSIVPGIGTAAGAGLGFAIGGALGTAIGTLRGGGKSHSEAYSAGISKTITDGMTISGELQNGFALELMKYADAAIERLKGGQNNGMWQIAIAYAADSEMSRNIIRACLSGELSKLDAEKLPMLPFEPKPSAEALVIPKFLNESDDANALCCYVNSAELGLLCTVPAESVPDFELRREKQFPLLAGRIGANTICIGHVVDGKRPMANMPFTLSEQDLNKHVFVCGLTGSGKSTTVKKILVEAKKPFLVIESAKKEYRNIAVETEVYTQGRPDIHAPHINPFYILPGVSPQVHIDYLKDLFNASFSFYGPMPYILEKCLHAVYKNKGWNLTLGYHPLLVNSESAVNFFSMEHMKTQYAKQAHKFLFPTMQELKDEIARYIDEELKYDGEVAGNVKTAMKVRLESLCVGAKGYTFNTSECLDFADVLKKNIVFELEGLADDSDKAFSVGLLVIFINEYRQVEKELRGIQGTGLQHLLVIEEAHRLLKNVATERTAETMGNPKGKAVEHFTNMLAEMRSYGQGVIVAEQIPTRLAPDVIKNSSTKIVHRIVSADDQETIANTIGITGDDAIQLGALEAGLAYCHKEGMALPIPVKILNSFLSQGEEKPLDVFVTDDLIAFQKEDSFAEIALSEVRSFFGEALCVKEKVFAFLNTLMVESETCCVDACEALVAFVAKACEEKDVHLPLADAESAQGACLVERLLSMMVRGVYRTRRLPEDSFAALLQKTLYAPSAEKITALKVMLQSLYDEKDLAHYAKVNVACLIQHLLEEDKNINIPSTVRTHFMTPSLSTVEEIENQVKSHAWN